MGRTSSKPSFGVFIRQISRVSTDMIARFLGIAMFHTGTKNKARWLIQSDPPKKNVSRIQGETLH